MPYHLEMGSGGHSFGKGKAIVVNTATGKHHSSEPIPIATAKRQMRLLEGIEQQTLKPRAKKE